MTNLWEVFEDEHDGQPIQYLRVNPNVILSVQLLDDGSVNPAAVPTQETFIPLEEGRYPRQAGSGYTRGWGSFRGWSS